MTPLTRRQQQVLNSYSRGMDFQAIADDLGIGIETVKYHAKHVRHRLDAKSMWQAVANAYQHRILP